MQALQFPAPSEPVPEPEPVSDLGHIPPPASRWRDLLATRTTKLFLSFLVLVLGAAAVLAWRSRTSPTTVQPSAVAEVFVRTYLTEAGEGAEFLLQPFLGYSPELTNMVPGTWYVTNTTAIGQRQSGDVYWITVAADTYGRVDGGFSDHEIQYFDVSLERDGQGFRATTLPSRAAAPTIEPSSTDEILPRVGANLPDSAEHAVTDYLTWYLTGTDGPYPESRPTTQYISVEVLAIEQADDGSLFTDVRVADVAGRSLTMTYPLRVESLEGRWLVTIR